MTLRFWTVSGAPSPWRVALGLAFKELDYDTKMLSASDKEHKSAKYLSLNPRGTIPTLKSGDLVLRNSISILAWLDRAYPDKPLFGQTADESGQIWQVTMEALEYLPPATHGVLSPIFFDGASEVTPELSEAAKSLLFEIQNLANLLSSQNYLSGDRAGAADAVVFPHIRLVQRAIDTKPDIMRSLGLETFDVFSPELKDWMLRIEDLPRVAETFPPHWAKAA